MFRRAKDVFLGDLARLRLSPDLLLEDPRLRFGGPISGSVVDVGLNDVDPVDTGGFGAGWGFREEGAVFINPVSVG